MPYKDPAKRAACVQNWRERNRDRMREYNRRYSADKKNWRITKVYGMTLEQYEARVEAQGGCCAICRLPPNRPHGLVIDHCHDSTEVRGLLCDSCNTAIGLLRDDPERLRRAASYLDASRAISVVA